MDAALFSPLTLYYCADPVDQAFCDAFDRHLAPLKHRGLIQTWSDGQILAGQDLQEEGERHLSTDHLLLLLLSPDYLASELGLHQIEVALHRSEESRAVVMLILVRPCSWQETELHGQQVLPRGQTAISSWPRPDEAWQAVVTDLNYLIKQILSLWQKPVSTRSQPDEAWQAVVAEIKSQIKELTEECPYCGLDAFTKDDARFFFGREEDVERLLKKLKSSIRFLAVLGPSGSGKSSIVQAGLIPQLQQGAIADSKHWGVIVTRPANDPFNQLATQGVVSESQNLQEATKTWLTQHEEQTRLVFVIDQFEELLTACTEIVRQKFVTQLLLLLGSQLPITVIITMRNDFYGQIVREEALAEWLERGLVNITQTLKPAEVTAIVRKPAQAVGLRFEDGLVEIIVENALESRPSSADEGLLARSTILPLLEFALKELWERREDGFLKHEAYDAIGGVTGGLTLWADRIFYSLEGKEKQKEARRIFTELVYLGNENQEPPDSRRRLPLAALSRNEHTIEETHQIVRKLVDGKLLITAHDMQSQQDMVEIIHDALLWEWGEMRQWLQNDRIFLLWHQELEKQAKAWVETNPDNLHRRNRYKLLRGFDLKEALKRLKEHADGLSQIELDFITASRKLRDLERRLILLGSAAVATGGGARAFYTYIEPLIPTYINITTFNGQHSAIWHIAWSPDGTRIASASGGSSDYKVQVWEATTGKGLYTYTGHTRSVTSVTWSPDDYRIASGDEYNTVQVWSSDGVVLPPNTDKPYIYKKHTDLVLTVAWSPDGKYIASGAAVKDRTVHIWKAASASLGELVYRYSGHTNSVNAVAWSPNSAFIASGSGDNTVQVWEATTGKIVSRYTGHTSHVLSVAWSPDGTRIASAGWDKTVQIWSAATGKKIFTYSRHSQRVTTVAWSPDNKYIASAGADQTVQVWDAQNGKLISENMEFHGNEEVRSVIWSSVARERLLASAGDDRVVHVWKLKQ